VSWYVSGGLDIGASILPIQFSSGEIPDKTQISISRGASLAFWSGIAGSREGTYDPNQSFLSNIISGGSNHTNNFSTVIGFGGSLFNESLELSVPIKFGSQQSDTSSANSTAASFTGSYTPMSSNFVSQNQSNNSYMYKNYTTPNGAVVDWNGNIITSGHN